MVSPRQIRLSILLALVLAWSPLGYAFQGKHRVIDWMEQLNLTDEQEMQLDRIDASYLERFKTLQMALRPEWGSPIDQEKAYDSARDLMNLTLETREKKRAILNAEQLKEADALVRQFHRSMTERYISRLTRPLSMTQEQQERIADGIMKITQRFDWPLVHEQADFARASAESLLEDVLEDDQLKKVMEEQIQLMRRWPTPPDQEERRPPGPPGQPGERPDNPDNAFNSGMPRDSQMLRDSQMPRDWQAGWRQRFEADPMGAREQAMFPVSRGSEAVDQSHTEF